MILKGVVDTSAFVKGIGTVALAGFLTNCCVESAMRSAYGRGYDVVTLTDCVSATSQEEQAWEQICLQVEDAR